MATIRIRQTISGGVQGVGFRPFIYRLALEHALSGFVLNAPQGVVIEVQGARRAVESFIRELPLRLPPLASIVSCESREIAAQKGEKNFEIRLSSQGQGHSVLISPDSATCQDCLAEIFDPNDRRYLYPFTNCTNCGPRLSITREIPYDRASTSMACFPMCPDCAAEYCDPLSRRFHAQPNACPLCGPRVWLTDAQGAELAQSDEAVRRTARLLAQGGIAAIKGLGGFHLACQATNPEAVAQLRRRKRRPAKALAIMVPDIETARNLALIEPAEEEILLGRARPILLLEKRPDSALAANLAPDTGRIGLMLPYAPLHHVLLAHYREFLEPGQPAALVMTSGNLSGEPIALGNREALASLAGFADLFLLHDRDILIRVDDSVLGLLAESGVPGQPGPKTRPLYFRRARGYVPSPVFLAEAGPCVLAVGAELKSTICLTKGDQGFVSQHLGDLENLKTYAFFEQSVEHYKNILQVSPKAVVADLHPNYLSTRYALEESGLPVIRLQHHFAHLYAVLAENRYQGPAVGLALDGTGLGEDGTLWGGEGLWLDTRGLEHKRLAHFAAVPLPGGEAAVKNPWRTAQAYFRALGRTTPDPAWPWLAGREKESELVSAMLARNLNSPLSSSCGRLFDAVAALLGLSLSIEYEGQAAIALEAAQDLNENAAYPFALLDTPSRGLVFDNLGLFAAAAEDAAAKVSPGRISRRFHLGLAQGLAQGCKVLAELAGTDKVALSGGVLQNSTLAFILPLKLKEMGLVPLLHRTLPPGDACISLGQALYGQSLLRLQGRI